MAESRVWVFFYGGYMNFDVLKKMDVVPEQWEVARVSGFDIVIRPLANMVRSDRHSVYGILVACTHNELDRLYAKGVLNATYFPEPVIAETLNGGLRPALCYVTPAMESGPAATEYIERVVKPAREFSFPKWYVERLESFRD